MFPFDDVIFLFQITTPFPNYVGFIHLNVFEYTLDKFKEMDFLLIISIHWCFLYITQVLPIVSLFNIFTLNYIS